MRSMMRHLPTALRLLLGIAFVFSGLNGLLHLTPMPAMPAAASSFLGALAATGYFMPVLKGCELAAGLALLANRFVPLALVVLAPIVVQIALFHTFPAPEGLPIAAVLVACEIALAWFHQDAFREVLSARSTPARIEFRSHRMLRS
jgi:uncharacterized membrane protein YphA (DoxX/SURF4 family)